MARDRILDGISLRLGHWPRPVGQSLQPLARGPRLEKQLCGTDAIGGRHGASPCRLAPVCAVRNTSRCGESARGASPLSERAWAGGAANAAPSRFRACSILILHALVSAHAQCSIWILHELF